MKKHTMRPPVYTKEEAFRIRGGGLVKLSIDGSEKSRRDTK